MPTKLITHKQFEETKGIKYLLHKELSVTETTRSLDILHAGELTRTDPEFCPRERAFLLKLGDNRKEAFLGTALNITFQIGRWYEDQVRNVWLRKFAIGTWVCSVCQTRHHYQTVPDKCSDCGESRYLDYEEPRAYSKKYDTSCGIDMLVWRSDKITVLEIKTIDKIEFQSLKAPYHEHHKRTQFYLDLLSESNWMDYDVEFNLDFAYILYVCKGFGFKDSNKDREGLSDTRISPFKEYKIKRGSHKKMLPIYDRALKVKAFKKTGILPKREVCPGPNCKRAARCTYAKECFDE